MPSTPGWASPSPRRTGAPAPYSPTSTPPPDGPRYAARKDFVYGEDVTIADWTISRDNLPRYPDEDAAKPRR
ncbi:hypothetical protein ABZZ74_10725 [Streptomyces sp. NPDC006476]|uniref:hypothetical protein n=1 Tax=Streptomyces sp. NPDC006476 TaxID=3157175 RepID=UPI0033BBF5EB